MPKPLPKWMEALPAPRQEGPEYKLLHKFLRNFEDDLDSKYDFLMQIDLSLVEMEKHIKSFREQIKKVR